MENSDIVVAPSAPVTREQFRFTGSGNEYFRIWIVNLLLSIVTLGIYSAWAKVRREQYFHRHTVLGGSSFDYHGQPKSILKGRLLVVGVLVAYNVLTQFAPLAGGAASLLFIVLWPWVLCQALRFRTYNTSWRGIRMGFSGDIGEAVKILYLYGLAVPFSLGIAFPWWQRHLQRFIYGHLQLGNEKFTCEPRTSDFYLGYLGAAGVTIVTGVVIGGAMAALAAVFQVSLPDAEASRVLRGVGVVGSMWLAYIVIYFIAGAFVRSRIGNATLNATRMGGHQFISTLRFFPLAWIMFSNLVLTIVTLGLYMPYAKIRLARYRASALAVDVAGGLDNFVADNAQRVAATGDEAADFLDIDLGF
ncbi:YjgN family protein [Uliginosibacterium sp. sgz301328]|uniref:YjgN family protein n=1 Tax=Uliginosibacterium sp. sgz301328 TaxID=3243764 RepID=UPI00359D5F4A